MAIINQQEDPNNPQAGPPSTGGSGGAAASSQGAAQTVGPVQQNQAPQQNQNFNDVSAYLNANQQGGTQLGQQVAQNVTNKYQSTMGNINQSAGAANAAVNSGYTPENTQLIQQVAANPTGAAADSGQLSAFQGQLNDTYSGPSNWADLGTQQGNVSQAQQYGNLINTPGGSNVLAQEVEGQTGQGMSQGINALDTMLLTGNPDAVQSVKTAAAPYTTIQDYLNSQNAGIQGNIKGAQNAAAQTSQDALNAFTGANGTLTNLNNAVNNTTAQDLSQAQAQQAAIKNDIANLYGGQKLDTTGSTLGVYGGGTTPWGNTTNYNVGQLSPQDLASLGMTQDQWTALQGQLQRAGTSQMMAGHNFGAGSVTTQNDISQYLNQLDPTKAVTNATTATPEQYAQTAAIQQLLGGKTPQGTALNPLNAYQANTYNPNGLNQFNYNAALNDTQNFADTARQQAQAEANAITANADLAHAESQHQGGIGGFIKNVVSHPFNNPISNFIENPLTTLASKQQIDNANNKLGKVAPLTLGTNI